MSAAAHARACGTALAAGRRVDPVTGAEYHMDTNPPPEDEAIKERLQPVKAATLSEQLSVFDRDWPELEAWCVLRQEPRARRRHHCCRRWKLFGTLHAVNGADAAANQVPGAPTLQLCATGTDGRAGGRRRVGCDGTDAPGAASGQASRGGCPEERAGEGRRPRALAPAHAAAHSRALAQAQVEAAAAAAERKLTEEEQAAKVRARAPCC